MLLALHGAAACICHTRPIVLTVRQWCQWRHMGHRQQMQDYIHVLELCAVLNTLSTFQEHLHNKVVHLICNNTVVVSATCKGFSRLQDLHLILCMLHLLLLKLDLTLIP